MSIGVITKHALPIAAGAAITVPGMKLVDRPNISWDQAAGGILLTTAGAGFMLKGALPAIGAAGRHGVVPALGTAAAVAGAMVGTLLLADAL